MSLFCPYRLKKAVSIRDINFFKQCYYGENTGTFHNFLIKCVDKIVLDRRERESV